MKFFKFSIALLTVIVLIAGFTMATGAVEVVDKLDISIQEVETYEDEKSFKLVCVNNTESDFSYGWAGSCNLVITTSSGTYSAPLSSIEKITAGETSRQVPIENCPGEIQKAVISELYMLDSRGLPSLPESNMENVVIYDISRAGEIGLNIKEKAPSKTFGKSNYKSPAESGNKPTDKAAGNSSDNSFPKFSEIKSNLPLPLQIFITCFIVFFICMVVLMIILYTRAYRKNKTAQKTFVPFQSNNLPDKEIGAPVQTAANNEAALPDGVCCKCGAPLPDESLFCTKCGAKQVKEYVQIFNREQQKENLFIDSINEWLSNHPNIFNAECEFKTRSGYGTLVSRYFLDSVAIKYELSEKTNENQYALLALEHFGLIKKSTDQLLEDWMKANPNVTLVNKSGGIHTRGDAGSELMNDTGSSNNTQLYLFFKLKRTNGTGV